MPEKKLNIVLGATDRASNVIKGVRGQVKGLQSEARRGIAEAGRNIERGAVLAAGFVAFNVAQGVQSLSQLAEVENQTAAVLESTGRAANVSADHIRARAEALENLSTVDDKVIQRGQNMLLTFTQIQNRVGKGNDIFDQATETALDMSVALGTDIKDSAIQLGKALNDPIRGVTALRRVGVQFTDQQRDQIKALVESGDLLGAQKIILRELATEFGGSAEAFGKGPGATMRRFGDAVEDAQMALARGFLPLIERVSAKAQQIFSDPAVIAGIEKFGSFVADKLDAGIGFLEANWDGISGAFQIMGAGAKAAMDAFASAPPWLQTAIVTGWGLNKLTGGALGNIVGSLGSGLIKGVLGMNAGVVNINAAVVNGGGGGPTTGGGGGGARGGAGGGKPSIFSLTNILRGVTGTLLGIGSNQIQQNAGTQAEQGAGALGTIAGGALAGSAFGPVGTVIGTAVGAATAAVTQGFIAREQIDTGRSFMVDVINDKTQGATLAELESVRAGLQASLAQDVGNPLTGALKWLAVNPEIERQLAAVNAQITEQNQSEGSRHTTLLASVDRQREAQRAAINELNASEGRRWGSTQGTLQTIANKRTVFNPHVNVTANIANTVVVSAQQTLYTLNSHRQSVNAGTSVEGFI